MKSCYVHNVLALLIFLKILDKIWSREFEIGPCYLQFLDPCTNDSIKFFLFTSDSTDDKPILLDSFLPMLATGPNKTMETNFKMIIHGYGGHLDANGSKYIRNGKQKCS